MVNALIGSLYVYRFTILPSLPDRYYDTIKKLITDFIWNGRKSKIAYEILVGLKDQGGGGLVHLPAKHKALKMQWVLKLKTNELMREMAYELLKNQIGDKVWEIHLTKKEIKTFIVHDSFWRDVLIDWVEMTNEFPIGSEQTRAQMIWLNTHIKIANKPILYKKWFEKGVIYIGDIVTEEGTLMPYDEFCNKYNLKVPYTKYRGIWEALPKMWIQWLKPENQGDENVISYYEKLGNYVKPTKTIYRMIMENDSLLYDKAAKLGKELQKPMDPDELRGYITNIGKITIYVKLRSFQYRLLMMSIVTNKKLFVWKIIESNQCSFCESECETLRHLFFDCKYVKQLWEAVTSRLKIDNLTYQKIICNNINDNPKRAENCIVLMTKYYIYRTRCLKERLSYKSCENFILNYVSIEEEIARTKGKIIGHQIKWAHIFD